MEFKDYYAILGVAPTATKDEIKRAYRKLARKYHPDVSKEPDGEARFKEVSEAHEALIDPERRAAYDGIAQRHHQGESFEPPPGWNSGFEFDGAGAGEDFSDFFSSLFGESHARGRGRGKAGSRGAVQGNDHHARITIDLLDAFHGGPRTLSLRMPGVDAQGRSILQDRQLEVRIPKGVREGQHLRLAGQGAPGQGGAPPGDLYLEVQFRPHPTYRLDERDLYIDLPVTPAEAALGAKATTPTPDGPVNLSIPAGSAAGQQLRLKGRGMPGQPPGDLYAVLVIALPPAVTAHAQDAYRAFAAAFPDFNPRSTLEA